MNYSLDVIYNNYLQEIDRQYQIYKKAQTNPELIITDMFDPTEHQPFYNHMYHILKSGGIKFHEFQKINFNQLKEFFSQIDNDIELELNYGSRIIYIKYKDRKIMRFSIYDHTYGDERFWLSLKRFEARLESDYKFLEELNNKLEKYQRFQLNHFIMLRKEYYSLKDFKSLKFHFRRIKDFFRLLYRRKTIQENLKFITLKTLNEIVRIKESIKNKEDRINELKKIEPVIEKKYKEWEQRFTDWGYKKCT